MATVTPHWATLCICGVDSPGGPRTPQNPFDGRQVVLALGLPLGSRFKGLSGPLGSAWGYGRAGFVEMASLQKHAVPLDERALAGLAHSSLALDTYAWLAQRLHRVPRGKPQLVPWASLKERGRHRDLVDASAGCARRQGCRRLQGRR